MSTMEQLPRGTVVGLRYSVELRLGQGGNGAVYLASDLVEGGRAVALKVLRADRLDAEREKGLRREYATLARLRHPHVEAVYDFGRDGRHGVYIAKEYLAGTDLMKATESLSPDDCLRLGAQLFRALQFLHARGLIHNDIKPDNVLVVTDHMMEHGLRSVLIDFGIASEVKAEPAGGPPKSITGTLGYMAPERLKGQPADIRSEIYAAGILMFRVLTRRYPFNVESPPKDIMMFHLFKAPPRVTELRPGISRAVDALMERLLAKEPAQRYQSPREVLEDIGRLLGREEALETEATQEGYVRSIPLVGRDDELARLTAFVQKGLSGKRRHWEPAVALIVGDAGIGKSRLLTEILVRARLGDARVLAGTSRKLGGALGPLRGGLRQLITDSEAETALSVLEDGETRERLGREKMLEALGRLLLERGDDVVLAVEDLHHADELTLDLLFYVARRLRAIPAARLVCVATTRDGGSARVRQFLERFQAEALGPVATLDALTEDETLAFVTRALSEAPPAAFVEAIHARSAGEPQALHEGLKFLMAAGLLSRARERPPAWDACVQALPDGALPILAARLSALPPDARRVLKVMALLDRPAPVALLEVASDLDAPRAASLLSDLARRELVVPRAVDREMFYATSHDRMAQAALEGAEAVELRWHHDRIARALESLPAAQADDWLMDLAHHSMSAGDAPRAARHGLRAGARMEALFAWDRAAEVYEGLTRMKGLDGFTQGAARLRLARVRESSGDVPGALRELAAAARVAREWDLEDVTAQALLRGAVLAARRGQPRRASARAARAGAIFEILQDEAGLAQVKSTLAELSTREGDPDRALALARESQRLHAHHGNRDAEAKALIQEGVVLLRRGMWEPAARCLERSFRLAHDIEALGHLGNVRLLAGQHDEASTVFRKALALARKQGRRLEEARMERSLGQLAYEAGDLRRAGELMEDAGRDLEAQQDLLEAASAFAVLARLRGDEGRYEESRQSLARAQALAGPEAPPAVQSLLDRTWAAGLLLSGDLDAARASASRALQVDRRLGDPRAIGFDLLPLAEAALEEGHGEELDGLLQAARNTFEEAGSPLGLGSVGILEARRDALFRDAADAATRRLEELHAATKSRGLLLLVAKIEIELVRLHLAARREDRVQPLLEAALAYARAQGAWPVEAAARLLRGGLLARVAGPLAARREIAVCERLVPGDNVVLSHESGVLAARLAALRGAVVDSLSALDVLARDAAARRLVRIALETHRVRADVAAAAGSPLAADAAGAARELATSIGIR